MTELSYTPEQREQIVAWIRDRGVLRDGCPSCRQSSATTSWGMKPIMLSSIPTLVLSCPHCAHLMCFGLWEMGVMIRPPAAG